MNKQTEVQSVKPRFTIQQVIAGAQKRWRSDITINALLAARISDDEARASRRMPHDGPYHDDGVTTLSVAVENALKLLRRHEGDKDYILSARELKERAKRQDCLGFGRAFMALLKNGTSVAELERAGNLQASLRKVEFYPAGIAESFIRYMKDNKHIALKDPKNGSNRNAIWVSTLAGMTFTDNGLVEVMSNVHPFFRVTQEAPKTEEV